MVKKIENKKGKLAEMSQDEKQRILGGKDWSGCGGQCSCGKNEGWGVKDQAFHDYMMFWD